MRLLPVVGWGMALWLASGLEAAWGTGLPGPLFLLAVAAGFCLPVIGAAVVAGAAGICGAAISGANCALTVAVCGIGAIVAGQLPRWVSRRNLLVVMGATGILTILICLIGGAWARQPLGDATLFALRRGGANALLMCPLYGMVIFILLRHSAPRGWVTSD